MAIAGKMYFNRFRTSGRPWCLEVELLLGWRSMSPPSSSFVSGACSLVFGKTLIESLDWTLSSGLGRRGDISLGCELFGGIAGIACANAVTQQVEGHQWRKGII
jgi:hypothetical protein